MSFVLCGIVAIMCGKVYNPYVVDEMNSIRNEFSSEEHRLCCMAPWRGTIRDIRRTAHNMWMVKYCMYGLCGSIYFYYDYIMRCNNNNGHSLIQTETRAYTQTHIHTRVYLRSQSLRSKHNRKWNGNWKRDKHKCERWNKIVIRRWNKMKRNRQRMEQWARTMDM